MDSQIISQDFKDAVAFGCKEAIRNLNRNLFKWRQNKKKAIINVEIKDINGLAKNWLTRCLKGRIKSAELEQIFKRGTFFVQLREDGNILNIDMNSLSHWDSNPCHKTVKETLQTLDYTLLHFKADDYQFVNQIGFQGYDPNFLLPLDDLRNFKF